MKLYHFTWMQHVYNRICSSYLIKSRPERTIEDMEMILFLLQYRSLTEDQVAIFNCKIHCHEEKISIPYISDLLRVMPITILGNTRQYYFSERKILNKSEKRLNQYRRYDHDKINKLVKEVLHEAQLDTKYFTFEPYDNEYLRKRARRFANCQRSFTLGILYYIVSTFSLASLIALVTTPLFTIFQNNQVHILLDRYLAIATCFLLFCILHFVWHKRWIQPTQFEKQHNYE